MTTGNWRIAMLVPVCVLAIVLGHHALAIGVVIGWMAAILAELWATE